MKTPLSALPIWAQITVIPALLLSTLLGIVGYTTASLAEQEQNAVVMNLAGRQRMLNQRLAKELLLVAEGEQVNLEVTAGLLASTANALRFGGLVPVGRERVRLQPADDAALIARLDQQIALLDQYNVLVADFSSLSKQRRSSETETSGTISSVGIAKQLGEKRSELMRLTQVLHESANGAVGLFQGLAQGQISNMKTTEMLIALSVLLLGAGISFVVIRGITRPLGRTVGVLGELHDGDIRRRIEGPTDGEMGHLAESVNDFLTLLNENLVQVDDASTVLTDGASSIKTASASLAADTGEQAAAIQQIAASVEEISSMAEHTNESSDEAASIAERSHKISNRGLEAMGELTVAMDAIKQSSDDIADVVQLIDTIAFQTNLLALNAAVEAARAGEAGRGFSVVAEEVRNLASRSAEAAKQTNDLIEEASLRAVAGAKLTETASEQLNLVADEAKSLRSLIEDISGATDQQNTGLGQIRSGLDQLSQKTQNGAATAGDLAASAGAVSSQAGTLNEVLRHFEIAKP